MVILNSSNAVEDARAFESSGISNFDVFDFAREGKKPDGTPVKLAFSLAFAQDEASPDIVFAVCQHHYPENFWNPAFQSHANGAKTVPGVALVADHLTSRLSFLKAFTGVSELHSISISVTARTENGNIDILEPMSFRDQFGVSPGVKGEGIVLGALRFAVADLAQTEALHRQNGIASQRYGGRLVVPPKLAHGATLILDRKSVV